MKNTTMLYISLGTNSIFLERIHPENIHALKDYEKFTLSKPQNTQKMYTDLADKFQSQDFAQTIKISPLS